MMNGNSKAMSALPDANVVNPNIFGTISVR